MRRRLLFEDSAKALYDGPEPGTFIQHFKDGHAPAVNAPEAGAPAPAAPAPAGAGDGRGVLNSRISEHLFSALNGAGVPVHFIRRLNMREHLVRSWEPFPFFVRVHNAAAGNFADRFGLEEGSPLPRAILEYMLRREESDDPQISEEHITAFNWAASYEMEEIFHLSLRVNDLLTGLFLGAGLKLLSADLGFGRFTDEESGRVILADEITPASCVLGANPGTPALAQDPLAAAREVASRFGLLGQAGEDERGQEGDAAAPPPAPQGEAGRGARVYAFVRRGVAGPKSGPGAPPKSKKPGPEAD